MEKKIELIAGACIVNDNNEVFLIKNKKWQQWVFCGGHVEFGETLDAAVKREIKEELGVEFSVVKQLNVMQDIDDKKHYVFVHFLVKAKYCEFVFNDEVLEPRWFNIEEALVSDEVHTNIKKTLLLLL